VMATDFPFGADVSMTMVQVPAGAPSFALHIRAPQWA
jgi:hypothetical protein